MHHHPHHHHHHQYFDENLHHYVPYSNETYPSSTSLSDHQENFPTIQTNNNELYEFLPEEIFQLDQPIIKSEAQVQNFNSNSALMYSIQPDQNHQQPQSNFNHPNEAIVSTNQSFLDLGSGEIQSGNSTKYLNNSNINSYSEINNNSNYQNNSVSTSVATSKDINSYNYLSQEPLLRTATIENEKSKKHSSTYQNYQCNNNMKRDMYLFQQSNNNYYVPEIYTSSSSSKSTANDVMMYRSMEKFNYIVNN